MEILLAAIYIAFCWVIFKIFRIPVNQWSLATATLGGLIGIVLLLLVMNDNHPFTTQARLYFTVTPILPGVRGRVTEVPVTPNVPSRRVTCCSRSIRVLSSDAVDQKQAQLAEAEQNVKQLKSALDQATAEKERMNAQSRLAQENYDRQQQLFDAKVISKATLDTFARNLENGAPVRSGGSSAGRKRAARLHLGNRRHEYHRGGSAGGARPGRIRARTDRDSCPGAWLRDTGRSASGCFHCPDPAHTSDGVCKYRSSGHRSCGGISTELAAGVTRGDAAEIAFDAVPGQIFHGEGHFGPRRARRRSNPAVGRSAGFQGR